MPFLSFAVAQGSYLSGGGHYVRGGSAVLSSRLVAIVREAGGQAETRRQVTDIMLDGDRVGGVRHQRYARSSDSACFWECRSKRARCDVARACAPRIWQTLPRSAPINFFVDNRAGPQPPVTRVWDPALFDALGF